MRNNTSFQLQ